MQNKSLPLHPFESIESALEFMVVLETVIGDVTGELQGASASATSERHANGLRLALFKVDQLAGHVGKSRRILNDLKMIRGVLTGDHMLQAA